MKIIILLLTIFVVSCLPIPDFSQERSYVKEIEKHPVKLEWFFYSAAYMETPDYITLQKFDQTDTICISDNIADLKFKNDIIMIGFYGKPKLYMNSIIIPKNVLGYQVVTDTSFILEGGPKLRKGYTKHP